MPNHAPSSSTTSQIFSTYTTQSATEIHPLDAYPHFSVLTTLLTFEANGPFQAEYRVYKHRRLRSGRLIKGGGLGIADLVLMAGLGWWIWVWMLQRCWSQDECMSTRGPQWVYLFLFEEPGTEACAGLYEQLSLVGAAALLVYLLIKSRTVLYRRFPRSDLTQIELIQQRISHPNFSTWHPAIYNARPISTLPMYPHPPLQLLYNRPPCRHLHRDHQ